jgi:hypothetical protein
LKAIRENTENIFIKYMIRIDYPSYPFKLKEENGKEFIFDAVRKHWVRLTPEEWVRQNFLQYLIQIKNYPAKLIAVEKEIQLGALKKRCDIVVYNSSTPWMIVECKETKVALNENVVKQILNYNQSLQVIYLIVTNGNKTYGLNAQLQVALDTIPDYHFNSTLIEKKKGF